jgi:hypothetical protein
MGMLSPSNGTKPEKGESKMGKFLGMFGQGGGGGRGFPTVSGARGTFPRERSVMGVGGPVGRAGGKKAVGAAMRAANRLGQGGAQRRGFGRGNRKYFPRG